MGEESTSESSFCLSPTTQSLWGRCDSTESAAQLRVWQTGSAQCKRAERLHTLCGQAHSRSEPLTHLMLPGVCVCVCVCVHKSICIALRPSAPLGAACLCGGLDSTPWVPHAVVIWNPRCALPWQYLPV